MSQHCGVYLNTSLTAAKLKYQQLRLLLVSNDLIEIKIHLIDILGDVKAIKIF